MSTDIATTSPLSGLAAQNGIFTTVKGDDFETKRKIFNAVNDAESISDLNGKPFEITDMVIETAEFVNDKTGEVDQAVRTIFITPEGGRTRPSLALSSTRPSASSLSWAIRLTGLLRSR